MLAKPKRTAFTLIELLVVISIIALLIGILLPALGSARETARAIKCSSGMRQVAIGFTAYTVENKDFYPPAYVYPTTPWDGSGDSGYSWDVADQIDGGGSSVGYVHWSWGIIGVESLTTDAFSCPTMQNGGVEPTFPGPGSPTDRQVNPLSYTANAAIVPRNKFTTSPGSRKNQLVKASWLVSPSEEILVTEFIDNPLVLTTPGGDIKSHRSLLGIGSGFFNTDDPWNYSQLAGFVDDRKASNDYRLGASYQDRLTQTTEGGISNNMEAVGRHHAGGDGPDSEDGGTTNFAYADGHVARKTLFETFENMEWGKKLYSVSGKNDVDYQR